MTSIACDDVGGAADYRTFHHLVIIRVSRDNREGVGNRHQSQERQHEEHNPEPEVLRDPDLGQNIDISG